MVNAGMVGVHLSRARDSYSYECSLNFSHRGVVTRHVLGAMLHDPNSQCFNSKAKLVCDTWDKGQSELANHKMQKKEGRTGSRTQVTRKSLSKSYVLPLHHSTGLMNVNSLE